jgi:penicillin-binding protein activator
MTRVIRSLTGGLVLALLAGCGGKTVTRVGTDTTIDLSGRWNDTDSRLVSEEMIGDALGGTWYTDYMQKKGDKPTVIVGTVRNKSDEHIAVTTFIGDIERAFVNSGKVRVVATAEEREEIRDERADQGQFASDETIKKFGQEHGADYMLIGTISTILDKEGGKEVRFYQTDMTLVDITTNEKAWIGQKKIKKYIGRSKYSG